MTPRLGRRALASGLAAVEAVPWLRAAATQARCFASSAGGDGGEGRGREGPDSLFCTNVSGLKGNSPILIGLMDYFTARSSARTRERERRPPLRPLPPITPSD